ncbi:gag-pol polyprotein [Cucumis melo var. makuwa]|nr:gag-pol polyprotein [Cucumis melo var. makuwa]
MCASFGSTRLMCASFGSTRLMCASFGSTRLMCASFGSTRLICASFGSTRLTCAFYGTTRLLCRVRAQRGADRREAGRTREGHMDASGFLIASAMARNCLFLSPESWVVTNDLLKSEKNDEGIRCHECERFGHIQSECATFLKRKKKSLVATFSDEEDYSVSDDEEVEMALISISTMNDEEAATVGRQAFDQLEPTINKCLTDGSFERKLKEDQEIILQQQERIQCLVEENQSFISCIVILKDELKKTKNQLEELSKFVKILTNGTKKLDDLLGQGRSVDDKRGLGFAGKKGAIIRTMVFVREGTSQDSPTDCKKGRITEVVTFGRTVINSKNLCTANNMLDKTYTGGDIESNGAPRPFSKTARHMIGNATFFSELSECKAGSVVFGDGGKASVNCVIKDIKSASVRTGVEEASLWHKRLGHISGTTLFKVTKADAIIGLPTLTFTTLESCSECLTGKQVKSPHKSAILMKHKMDLGGLMKFKAKLKGKNA